jgi:Lrp/AsnC family leucine-responsive transcriptional regulator
LKVRCRGTKDLDRIISRELRTLPGVFKTRTTIVLNTFKETQEVPLAYEN